MDAAKRAEYAGRGEKELHRNIDAMLLLRNAWSPHGDLEATKKVVDAAVAEALKERDEQWRKERIKLITDAQLDLNEARREEQKRIVAALDDFRAWILSRPPATAPEGTK